jgi:hypothetical protein
MVMSASIVSFTKAMMSAAGIHGAPPYHLVAEDRIRLVTGMEKMAKGLSADDYERLSENVFRKFSSFLAKRDGEQN